MGEGKRGSSSSTHVSWEAVPNVEDNQGEREKSLKTKGEKEDLWWSRWTKGQCFAGKEILVGVAKGDGVL